jgi:prostaglandin-H2 D-isomerase / glutathione transferase
MWTRSNQVPRLAFTIGGIPFKDNRIAGADFPALKSSGSLPFGSLPVLIIDGEVVAQSTAISRYAGKLAGLYPKDDDLLAARVDEFLYGIDDGLTGIFKGNDAAARGAWVETDVPRYFGALEKIARENSKSETWVCGAGLTIADVKLYCFISTIKTCYFDNVAGDLMERFPRLMASYDAVGNHPKVMDWNKVHP